MRLGRCTLKRWVASPRRQQLGHVHGIGTALADVQQQVLAFTRGLEGRQFVDLEIVRRGADACGEQRRTERQRYRNHAATSSTTA
ncbi:hypothetical protein G6F59_017928 [Rhizopus arrhizus]|nr:hypothetical protein G6F59_017928 [Rhizopus arrhizus]